ncbi:hypothetical protein ACFSKL_04535 [Belliella marina]|uniref:MORN repeat protein n=1 Tax=Belliella marina TaxID=1644146 RepID=A0ABW4VH79_9BACT
MKDIFIRIYMGVSGVLILVLSFLVYNLYDQEIIRTKGIIVEDEHGRDRILIGAPIPESKDRVRTDLKKVEEYWAGQYGEQYMEWYKDYYHGTNGMVVMDEHGIDKLLVGDKLADANGGVRISESTGIIWNDENGMERGGVGVDKLKENNQYRGTLGFDDNTGAEGFHLAQFEDGSQLLRMVYQDGYLLFGQAKPNSFLQNQEPFIGIVVFDKDDNIVFKKNFIEKE